ncbi:MAG: flagellar motor switch protein FliN [Ruminococcus sp.]|jgi:flagellar motor switch protein FliN/FliY|nr:flagellar motor switch protein FliN [Ruminococcus sp.]
MAADTIFGDLEKDAIGEIMNITMGSAATAVSTMLSAKVWITTPTVDVAKRRDLGFPELEPSVVVKITYIKGISGQNVLVLKQSDVQLILAQLMGLPLEVTDDFQFDEMNVSAVCEVMNQMMGASATALSEIIETPVDISTPQALIQEGDAKVEDLYGIGEDEDVCVVKFRLTIDNVINSEFISVLTIDLAKEMANKMMHGFDAEPEPEPEPEPAPAAGGGGGMMTQEQIEAMMSGMGGGGGGAAPPAPAAAPPMPGMPAPDPANPYGGYPPPGYPPMPGAYPPYPGAGYPGMPAPGIAPYGLPSEHNVQIAQFQAFENYQNPSINKAQNDNLKLLMDVPLDVTVEIGSATKKVKEILDFSQGTIIELERQAGAPVDVIVNGNLVAKGDVVVIDDNFAVRITEIIRSRFLESIGGDK